VAKKLAFIAQTTATYFLQKLDRNIGFCEKRQLFPKNWRKSQKIVTITLNPGHMIVSAYQVEETSVRGEVSVKSDDSCRMAGEPEVTDPLRMVIVLADDGKMN
jgi:hypothetical protein